MSGPVLLRLPFEGPWLVQNSPARRVPSHGTTLLASSYAIDFVGVDGAGRTAPFRDWRTLVATEPPERFFAFGRPVLAPVNGVVVAVHDGEPDHSARRSQLALVPYMLGQAGRLREGVAGVAGNHVILRLGGEDAFVALAHLKKGSLRVGVGDRVRAGEQLAECGNSGNSTQPHVHVQAMTGLDLEIARAWPIHFSDFRERARGTKEVEWRDSGVPREGSVIEAVDSVRKGR